MRLSPFLRLPAQRLLPGFFQGCYVGGDERVFAGKNFQFAAGGYFADAGVWNAR
jgi:hypothetical protein